MSSTNSEISSFIFEEEDIIPSNLSSSTKEFPKNKLNEPQLLKRALSNQIENKFTPHPKPIQPLIFPTPMKLSKVPNLGLQKFNLVDSEKKNKNDSLSFTEEDLLNYIEDSDEEETELESELHNSKIESEENMFHYRKWLKKTKALFLRKSSSKESEEIRPKNLPFKFEKYDDVSIFIKRHSFDKDETRETKVKGFLIMDILENSLREISCSD